MNKVAAPYELVNMFFVDAKLVVGWLVAVGKQFHSALHILIAMAIIESTSG